MKTTIARGIAVAVVAVVVAACSSSPQEPAAPAETTAPPSAPAEGGTWVLMGSDPSEECPIGAESGGLQECRPASAANQEVYAAATLAVTEYLQLAWEVPVQRGLSDREAMAVWTGFLHPDADLAKWSAGPTYFNSSSTDREEVPGDIRIALWKGDPDAPLDDRWFSQIEYSYVVTRMYTEYVLEAEETRLGTAVTLQNPGSFPRVAIHRDTSGRLLSVFIPWGAEVLYTLPEADGVTRGVGVVATAELRPVGDSDSDLRIVTPDAQDSLGHRSLLVGTVQNVQSYHLDLLADGPEDRSGDPLIVTPGVPAPTIDVDSYFLPSD